MTLESGTFISDLNVNYPETNALISGGDNHIRWTKSALKNTFPAVAGAITASHTTINTSIASVVAATNANTANALVKRDSSGNISAGAITGTSFTTTGNMNFGDNDKALFGAGSDLQIYHDASNSYIDDVGTGSLHVRANNLYLQKYTGENYLAAIADGAVNLYYNNSQKLATTNTGIDITGTATSDGLTVKDGLIHADQSNYRVGINTLFPTAAFHAYSGSTDCVAKFNSSDSSAYVSLQDTNTSHTLHGIGAVGDDLALYANNAERVRVTSDGKLGIGTASPARKLTVQGGSGDNLPARIVGGSGTTKSHIEFQDASTTADYKVALGSVGDELTFQAGGSERMRIDASGKVGIGTDSPTTTLDVSGNATFDNGTSTTVNIACDDAGTAELKLMGTSQGTGRLYVGQSSSHGGGIEYNGDSTPVTAGAGSDFTALFRRTGNSDAWTARNHSANNNWEFRGNLKANGNLEADGSLVGAIKTKLFNEIYPIGAIYISTTSTSPATLFGGSWSSIGGGRVLQTVNGSSPSAGANYSSNTRTISTSNMPSHRHSFTDYTYQENPIHVSGDSGYGSTGAGSGDTDYDNKAVRGVANNTAYTGSGTAFNVQQASYGVYMWRRTGLA